MALKSNGVTQVPDGLGLPGKVLRVNSSGTAGEWGDAVDGRNSVSDGTKLDSIESGATADQTKADIEGLGIDVPATNLTGTIPAARLSTATTQAESDDSTKIATTAYVVDKITTLIGGAPSTLNDLNELAAAINDDANYNTTLTTALGTKLPLAGGTMTGDISLGDNVSLNLGDSDDASLVFDGTDTTLTTTGELIFDGQTGITIDCNNRTNQNPLHISNMGAGSAGIVLSRTGVVGWITIGSRMDHARTTAIAGTNKSLAFIVNGSYGDGSYAAFDFTVDANGSSRHPAVMGVRSPNNNALLFQGEQSDSTVVFSVDYDGNVATSGTVDGVDIAARDAILTSTTTTAGAALPKAGGTLTGNATFGDNNKAIFGSNNDLNIRHDPTNGSIFEHINSTSTVSFRTNGPVMQWWDTQNGGYYIHAARDGAISLAYARQTKFATTSTGIDVTGVITTDGMTTSADINFGDNNKAIFGAGSDLQIYHDGTHSYIKDAGTGYLKLGLSNAGTAIQNGAGTNLLVTDAYAVSLRYNGGQKLNTSATGITVTGNIAVSGTVDGRDIVTDGNKLDDIETGATADQTAAQILTAIKTVDGSSSGLDADNLDGVTWGNINTTLQTSTNIKAYNGTTEIKSDGIYFESGTHCITWNDGKGNFNVRVGHDVSENVTETGYASHIEWSQSSGWMEISGTTSSRSVGNAITWSNENVWEFSFSDGQFSSPGDVVAYSSDRRLKTNITNIDNALDKVLKLNGVHFDWADDIHERGFHGAKPGEKAVGVIAQEVEAVLPELVAPAPFDVLKDQETGEHIGSKSGEDYKTVKYEKLTALLIEAVKELSAKVDLQQEEIDRLKRQ